MFNMFDHKQNVLETESFLRANHRLEGGILINPDGILDDDFTQAVNLFQKQNGLEITGIVDFDTWTLLAETAKALCIEETCILSNIDKHSRR